MFDEMREDKKLEKVKKRSFVADAEEMARQHRLAREDAERRERTLERENRKLIQEATELAARIKEMEARYGKQEWRFDKQTAQDREKEREIAFAYFCHEADYDVVKTLIPSLSDDELQDIYQKAQEERASWK